MTLEQYMRNPMGKGDASISNKDMIKSALDSKYNALISKYPIRYSVYKIRGTDDWYIHLVIQSESARTNDYDVVFRFYNKSKSHGIQVEGTLNNYDIQLFSNSQSFTYTYAYVYNSKGLLVDCLRNKFNKKALTIPPNTRNQYNIVNYEKYIYFGAKHILTKIGLNKSSLSAGAIMKEVSLSDFRKVIRSTEQVEHDYKKADKELKFKKEHVGIPNRSDVKHGLVSPSALKPKKTVTKTKNALSIKSKRPMTKMKKMKG